MLLCYAVLYALELYRCPYETITVRYNRCNKCRSSWFVSMFIENMHLFHRDMIH